MADRNRPLQALLGFVEMLLRTQHDGPVRNRRSIRPTGVTRFPPQLQHAVDHLYHFRRNAPAAPIEHVVRRIADQNRFRGGRNGRRAFMDQTQRFTELTGGPANHPLDLVIACQVAQQDARQRRILLPVHQRQPVAQDLFRPVAVAKLRQRMTDFGIEACFQLRGPDNVRVQPPRSVGHRIDHPCRPPASPQTTLRIEMEPHHEGEKIDEAGVAPRLQRVRCTCQTSDPRRSRHNQKYNTREDNSNPVPGHKPFRSVRECPGVNGRLLQILPDIAAQTFRRCISPVRVLVHGFSHNVVKIPAQLKPPGRHQSGGFAGPRSIGFKHIAHHLPDAFAFCAERGQWPPVNRRR